MSARSWRGAAAVAAFVMLSGCAGAAESSAGAAPATPSRTGASAAPSPTVPTTVSPTLPSVGADLDGQAKTMFSTAMMRRLKADVVRRAGVDEDAIEVVTRRRRTFSDGSLGCPEPGKVYTQALVEGAQVILAVGGQRYDYRISDRGSFRLCEQPGGGKGPGLTPKPFPSELKGGSTERP